MAHRSLVARAFARIGRARLRALILAASVVGPVLASRDARAEEFGPLVDKSSWTLTWGGYLHVAYRWVQQPQLLNLAGRNNGFQLEQARVGLNVQFKDYLAGRISFEGASEDRLSQSFAGGTITARLRDAYLTYGPLRALRISLGQQVTPWDLDSMRSDAELPFVSRAVGVEGVQPQEGRATLGMGKDRSLGLSIHSGDIPLGARSSVRYSVFVGNGNGQNQLLNDNNLPAVFGRFEYAFWDKEGPPSDQLRPMYARSDRKLPILGIGLAGQYNPRTVGNPPDLLNETDVGGAFDIIFAMKGLDIQGGLLYLKTSHDSLAGVPDWERFGWWAHVRFTIPRIPVLITPGYRIANYAPRAHLATSAATPMDTQADSDLGLLYHTIGVVVRPVEWFPAHLDVNYTITQERGTNSLQNDRFEADLVAVF